MYDDRRQHSPLHSRHARTLRKLSFAFIVFGLFRPRYMWADTHIRWLRVRCLHHRSAYPLKRKCQKLFWYVFYLMPSTLHFYWFFSLLIPLHFCLCTRVCKSAWLLEPLNFMEWTDSSSSSSWTISYCKRESFYFSSVIILGRKKDNSCRPFICVSNR